MRVAALMPRPSTARSEFFLRWGRCSSVLFAGGLASAEVPLRGLRFSRPSLLFFFPFFSLCLFSPFPCCADMKAFPFCCLLPLAALSLTMCEQNDNDLMPAGMVQPRDAEAERLYAEAEALARSGKIDDAISKLDVVVTQHTLSTVAPRARLLLGDLYERDGDYRQAFKEYQKLIERYHSSSLYEDALNRQLQMAMKAVNGEMKTDVAWGLWKTDMEASVVEEWLQSIAANAPYSDMAATALAALAKFQLTRLNEPARARATYQTLVQRYPNSPMVPAAQLMVAQLWASESTRGNDNLVNLAKAQEAYEEFLLRFPNDRRAGLARQKVGEMRALLVEQELETGRYYLERAHLYSAAAQCFRNVQAQASVNPEAAREAKVLYERAAQLAAREARG